MNPQTQGYGRHFIIPLKWVQLEKFLLDCFNCSLKEKKLRFGSLWPGRRVFHSVRQRVTKMLERTNGFQCHFFLCEFSSPIKWRGVSSARVLFVHRKLFIQNPMVNLLQWQYAAQVCNDSRRPPSEDLATPSTDWCSLSPRLRHNTCICMPMTDTQFNYVKFMWMLYIGLIRNQLWKAQLEADL